MTVVDPTTIQIDTEQRHSVPDRRIRSRRAAEILSHDSEIKFNPSSINQKTETATDGSENEEPAPTVNERQITVGGYGVSLLLHLSIIAILATIILKVKQEPIPLDSITLYEGAPEPVEAIVDEEPIPLATELEPQEKDQTEDEPQPVPEPEVEMVTIDNAVQDLIQPETPTLKAEDIPLTAGVTFGKGAMFAGRGAAARQMLVAAQGGNSASEQAVALGLRWLADHQRADGSWSFDHRGHDCDKFCSSPGGMTDCAMGATSMALLTFLGAGHTHKEGEYSSQVQRGLEFMLKTMRETDDGMDLRQVNGQGSMYVHGLATMVLSESFAMTNDRSLYRPTQLAVNFIVKAQHHEGGWRYGPQEPGDTSVVGWQVLALESARSAKFVIPRSTFGKTTNFLDSVQSYDGARYGYMTPGDAPTTSAVGLLCRMYFGWERDRPEIREGVAYLSSMGPNSNNMYYNYYATQVLHHYGGEEWKRWNVKMRDHLVATQVRRGHARGSWEPKDPHAGAGGRLYMTTLCTMTLEVYYRHLPLYQWNDFEK